MISLQWDLDALQLACFSIKQGMALARRDLSPVSPVWQQGTEAARRAAKGDETYVILGTGVPDPGSFSANAIIWPMMGPECGPRIVLQCIDLAQQVMRPRLRL